MKKEEKYTDIDGTELYVKYIYGVKRYYLDYDLKIYHRLDGPAIEYDSENYTYIVNGLIHRVGGPAYYWMKTSRWWVNDKIVNVYYIYG